MNQNTMISLCVERVQIVSTQDVEHPHLELDQQAHRYTSLKL